MKRLLLTLFTLLALFGCADDSNNPDVPIDAPSDPDAPIDPDAPDPAVLGRLELTGMTRMWPGLTAQYTVEAFDLDDAPMATPEITWTSSAPEIVGVSATGEVTAYALGVVTIMARHGDIFSWRRVAVYEPIPAVVRVDLLPDEELVLAPNTISQLMVYAYDIDNNSLNGRAITWTNTNPLVAAIGPGGQLTALATGTTTLTVNCEGKTDSLTVRVRIPAARVELDTSTFALQPTQTRQLVATVLDANNSVLDRAVTWSIDAPAIASVSDTGLVTAHAAGTATLTATADGATAQVTITVRSVDRILLTSAQATIAIDEQLQVTARLFDSANQPLQDVVTWSSDHPEFASVDPNGLITGRAEGGAIITATSGAATATVLVFVAEWTERTLFSVNGAAAPATMYSYTMNIGGSDREIEMQAVDGVLAIRAIDARYELMVFGPVFLDGEETGFATHSSAGTMHWDAAQQRFQFTADVPFGGRSFTGRYVNGALEITYQPDAKGAPATLVFAVSS